MTCPVIMLAAMLGAAATLPPLRAQAPQRRLLTVDDHFRLHRVSDLQISPDGQWVAYVISTSDLAKDRSRSRTATRRIVGCGIWNGIESS